jgi:translation initiation factor eIF-2B subunit beta
LTYSDSDLLISFLKAAHQGVEEDDQDRPTQGKDFEVLVCETAPSFKGHTTAKSLQEEGIDAKLITDSSIYALMSGVDKVIISTHAIMANGGLLANAGAYQICLAAKVS